MGTSSPLDSMCGQIKLVPVPARSQGDRVRTLITSSQPDMAERLASREFSSTLGQALEQGDYDAVQVEGIEMARYIPLVRTAAPRSPVIFDDHNAEYLLQARAAAVDIRQPAAWPKALYSLIQWRKLKRFETQACSLAQTVMAVSPDDIAALRRLVPGVQPRLLPNGVDTEYFRSDSGDHPGPLGLLFTGTMDFRPNVDAIRWFVSDILPRVSSRNPGRQALRGRTIPHFTGAPCCRRP